MLKKTYQKGFTVVELLIVIVVIGILAALVLNTFAGIQQRARDTERKTDINAIATQLEAYYNTTGESTYPDLADLQSQAWVDENLPGLDEGALRAPGQTTISIGAGPASDRNTYGYVSDGEQFTLTWFNEDEGSTQAKESLNKPATP